MGFFPSKTIPKIKIHLVRWILIFGFVFIDNFDIWICFKLAWTKSRKSYYTTPGVGVGVGVGVGGGGGGVSKMLKLLH